MVHINLTSAQVKKVSKGQGIQIPHHQLVSNSGEHPVELNLDKKTINKINRNMVQGKGFRLPKGAVDIHGGNFLSTLKSIGKVVAPIAKTVAPKLAGLAVGAVAGPTAGKVAQEFADAGIKSAGGGIGKFKKGSAEAKAHMARIRSMKKTSGNGMIWDGVKSVGRRLGPVLVDLSANEIKRKIEEKTRGKGFFDVLKKAGSAIAPIAVKTLVPIGTKMLTDTLVNHMSGEGLYKQIRHGKVMPGNSRRMTGKVKNPRIKPTGRILINGIDQVEGGSYSGFGYA
jgi:hypothetical protein